MNASQHFKILFHRLAISLPMNLNMNRKPLRSGGVGSEEKREKTSEILANLGQILEEVPTFDVETVETAIWKYTDENDIKRVAAMQALRIALTGTSFGPSLFDIVTLLGRDAVLKRIPRAIAHL